MQVVANLQHDKACYSESPPFLPSAQKKMPAASSCWTKISRHERLRSAKLSVFFAQVFGCREKGPKKMPWTDRSLDVRILRMKETAQISTSQISALSSKIRQSSSLIAKWQNANPPTTLSHCFIVCDWHTYRFIYKKSWQAIVKIWVLWRAWRI